MGQVTDKIKGTANEVAGKAKQAYGDATDNEQKKSEGAAQELRGKGQQVIGDAKGAVKRAIDKI